MISLTYPRNAIPAKKSAVLSTLLLMGLAAAIYIRILIGGNNIADSKPAGLAFAICLYCLVAAAGTKVAANRRVIKTGILGGLFLCGPALALHFINGQATHADGNYLTWAVVVAIVVMAEEAFLRGALFDAVNSWRGETAAIIIAAIAFTALHIPLYGWHIVPLDMAVGLWLGALRVISGSFVAPGIAHLIADLVGWWL
jgi:membrane protease YdiL (CAAX protease family)